MIRFKDSHCSRESLYKPLLSVHQTCLHSQYISHPSLKINQTMISMCKKPLFLGAKATIIVLLILAASVTLVIATRPSSLMTKKPKFGASSMYFPQSNRPIQPSGPNPCSYLSGPGQCKPPKWCMLHIVHQYSVFFEGGKRRYFFSFL